MSKKAKLITRLKGKPKDLTWDEAQSVLIACGFKLQKGSGGSGRLFVHEAKGIRVRLHEPHPRPTLLPYMVDILIEGLTASGDL